jgi:hypothetical protein
VKENRSREEYPPGQMRIVQKGFKKQDLLEAA